MKSQVFKYLIPAETVEKGSVIDRRHLLYNSHIPERKSGKEQRSGLDRRKPRTSK